MPDVVNEIKDEKTRQSLQVLPYELHFREPTDEDIKFVAHFAKRTGDFVQLSTTDIRVLALMVRLEKEHNAGANLKEAPKSVTVLPTKSPATVENPSSIGGDNILLKDLDFFGYSLDKAKSETDMQIDAKEEQEQEDEQVAEEEDAEEEEYDVEEDDGWITKDNCDAIRQKLMGIKLDEEEEASELVLGCITGDYAMQNVLLQMGLNVISPKDGLRIRQTKQFVLRCFGCFRLNPPNTTQFCKFCGNQRTLKRVAVTVTEQGETKIHINFRKPINTRGMKYSLPMPRGGKHSNDLLLCEDQRPVRAQKSKQAMQEKKKLTMDTILNDPYYVARTNPFALNDVYSRGSRFAAAAGGGRQPLNPNETRKPTGNRKKKSSRY